MRGLLFYIGVLAIIAVGNTGYAIKCYQCKNCPDANKLPPLDECSFVNIMESTRNASWTVKKIKPDASKQQIAAQSPPDEYGPPAACFKASAKVDGKELVYRGCFPSSDEYTCVEFGLVIFCVCEGDGCNGAQTVLSSTLLIACFSVVIMLLYF